MQSGQVVRDNPSVVLKHLPHIDGLRGLTALYVVLGHASYMTWPRNDGAGLPRYVQTVWVLLSHGDIAVTIFLAVSGFCLMLPLASNDFTFGAGGVGSYFHRRARRILPPYYLVIFLSILLNRIFMARPDGPGLKMSPTTRIGFVSHLLLLHNLHDSTMFQINGPLWSIALECQLYVIFPLLVWMRRRVGMPALLGAVYLVAIWLEAAVVGTAHRGLVPILLFVFTLGMYAAEIAHKSTRPFLLICSAVGALLLHRFLGPHVVAGICAACGMVLGAQHPTNSIARFVSWKPIVTVGTFSYSLYMLHFPLQLLLWKYVIFPLHLTESATFFVGATIGTLLILGAAHGFYLACERPFLNRKMDRSRRVTLLDNSNVADLRTPRVLYVAGGRDASRHWLRG